MDYLKTFEKFNDIKEVADYIDDVLKLRWYYDTKQYVKMQAHINALIRKHAIETAIWNSQSGEMATTYKQAYINAENFLQMHGAIIVAKNVKDHAQRLKKEEISFIESMIKPME